MMGCGGSKYNSPESVARKSIPSEDLQKSEEEILEIRNRTNMKPKVEITIETLQKYLDLEKELNKYEKKHVLEAYQIKSDHLEQLEMKIQQLEEKERENDEKISQSQSLLDENTRKSLKQFLIDKNPTAENLTAEQRILIEDLNNQEMIKRELETTVQQRDKLKEEVIKLGKEGEEYQILSQKQDEFLDSIFGGSYGSDLENRLEKEVDLLKERKQHIDQAYFKWKQGHVMVKQGCAQLGYALKKWKDLLDIDLSDHERRYYEAAEVRNYLLAATQNIQGAQRCLPNVSFPYCAPEELENLNKAITYIFTDMQIPERHKHAFDFYNRTYRRAGALKQWFEQVLDTTISKDLAEVSEDCKNKSVQLRRERINLIRMKVKEITGKDVEFDTDSAIDSEADDVVADEQIAQIFEADRIGAKKGFLMTDPRLSTLPTPLPISDLAPMPSNEEIFGKIDELRKRHAAEMEEFKKAQTLNKARMVQGLQEKLEMRRNRRSRILMHERESAALQSR
ncbi:uncharacterized protein LOC111625436 [Centruroides sculpturatus]|uniref:uncharacterized protein LOC111625436 n=1 Tax=Centruroides sculpturatus TaxID=218467 RepID=UPI000C6CA4C7|nr:uncharacterized protein LOC111625436 [Centruroides sculpturatus]